MWNEDTEFGAFINAETNDGSWGSHGPYLTMSHRGTVHEIHAWHVVRDYNSSYPCGVNEWSHMCETGKLAWFHAEALFSKPTRVLLARTIIVVRGWDGLYVWCVRFHRKLDHGYEAGRHFLWPLPWRMALAFYDQLCDDPEMSTSSLVNEYPVAPCALYPCSLMGARKVTAMENVADRVFTASINVVSSDPDRAISRRWRDPGNLRGLWLTPLQLGAPTRRSPRLTGPPLVDVLVPELVDEVVRKLLAHYYLSAQVSQLHTVLQTRLVCKAFNRSVCEGMARTTRRILGVVRPLVCSAELELAYTARATLAMYGVNLFRAMEEVHKWVPDRPPSLHDEVRIYMRLLFNKRSSAVPPRAPVKALPPPWKRMHVMTRVLGKHVLCKHAHGTRHTQQRRVRFRMKVPGRDLPNQITKGWKYVPEPRTHERCMCPLHSGALAA